MGAMILPPSAEEPLALNRPAAMLWHLLDEPSGLDGLCEDLAEIFGAESRLIEPDVRATLTDFIQHGVLERVP
jgi:coenzyme PQQ synthesis protein D (PqqD)